MKQMIDIDVFDTDERIVVNKSCEGTPISEFTRERFMTNLTFARNISTEQDIIDLLDGLIAKVEDISESEWETIKNKIPFGVYYDVENNVDEVPIDEVELLSP